MDAEASRTPIAALKLRRDTVSFTGVQHRATGADQRSTGGLGEQKGQITRRAAEDALTFSCRVWSQKKGRVPGGGKLRLW